MKNRGWTLWLVIFMCSIVFGLGWIVIGNRQSKKIDLLNQEIKRLDEEIKQLGKSYSPQKATPSAQPSSTPSAVFEPKISTNSGCITCGE